MRAACALLLVTTLVAAAPAHGASDVRLRGLLDLSLASSNEVRVLNRLTFGDSNLDPYRLRLFLDARLSPTLEVHVQTILHEGLGELRADGAYALWMPWPGRDLSLEAGKIPSLIGVYAPRTYSDQNWLLTTPLLYQYRTSLPWDQPVANVDDLVAGAGHGQIDVGRAYLPIVDERWWDAGAAVIGAFRPIEFSLGVVQGSPSWPSPGADDTPGQSVLGRLGWVPTAGVRVGVSASDGAWMPAWFAPTLAPGHRLREYRETTVMADAEFARGPLELRGEAARRDWETVALGTLRADAGYAEARLSFASGAWLALRGESLRFADVTTSSAVTRPWDLPVDRFEAVAGYRLTRDVRMKVGAQRTVRHAFEAPRLTDDALLASLGIRF